jgi:hypothetical protein
MLLHVFPENDDRRVLSQKKKKKNGSAIKRTFGAPAQGERTHLPQRGLRVLKEYELRKRERRFYLCFKTEKIICQGKGSECMSGTAAGRDVLKV